MPAQASKTPFMKKSLIPILLLFLISFSLHSQDSKQKRTGRIGISFIGFGVVHEDWDISNDRYEGGTYDNQHYREKLFYTIGFNYLKPVNLWLDLETGLEYSRKLGEVKNVFFGDAIIEKANSTMASIPLTLRANFLRFFFVNAGLLTDLDLGGYDSQRYQSGVGPVFGLGAKYDFKSGAQIFINPYFKRRAIISFSADEERLKMDEAGIRVGLYFNLKGKD
jgi:hypothetical protein